MSEPIAKKSVFPTHVTSAVDCNKVSDRLMAPIAAALAKAYKWCWHECIL